jgi:hypothetical protein
MPTIGATVVIEGAEELILVYQNADSFAEGLLMEGMTRSVNYGVRNAAMAPEETEANQPPPPYYIRDVGTQYKDSNRLESQHMSREESWNKTIEQNDTGVVGTIEPIPTYAPYLHGTNRQIARHAANKWRKVDEIATDISEHIYDIFAKQTKRLVAYLKGR